MRDLAARGRTVFVSSHLMTEMALTADHLIVIGRGRLLADTSTEDFISQSSSSRVRVRSPQQEKLSRLLSDRGAAMTSVDGYLELTGLSTAEVGDVAAANSVTIHELFQKRSSLEDAFMELTGDSVEYHAEAASPEVRT